MSEERILVDISPLLDKLEALPTIDPETLGAFLRGLPVIEAPWDEAFQRKYCAGCGKVSCDDGSPCPYEDKRNNPLWWLSQESEGTQHA